MQSEEIRELTASLPLTLDEEYQMQQTWLNDKDKCTFIVLDRERYNRTHDEIGRSALIVLRCVSAHSSRFHDW